MELKTLLKEVIVTQVETGLAVTVRQEEAVFDGSEQIGSNGELIMSFGLGGDQAAQVAAALSAQGLWAKGSELVVCNVFPRTDGSVSVSVASRVPIVDKKKTLGYRPTVRGVVELDQAKIAAVTSLIESFGVSLG